MSEHAHNRRVLARIACEWFSWRVACRVVSSLNSISVMTYIRSWLVGSVLRGELLPPFSRERSPRKTKKSLRGLVIDRISGGRPKNWKRAKPDGDGERTAVPLLYTSDLSVTDISRPSHPRATKVRRPILFCHRGGQRSVGQRR